ncbi:MAG: hypothetical protein Q8R08_03050 [bacterium]|nr:hypothetical protein [bacterium]
MRAYPKRGDWSKPEGKKIAEKILGTAVIGTTVVASPLVGMAVFLLGIGATHYLFRKGDFNREAKRLQKRGYIALTKTEDGWVVKILRKGINRYKIIQIHNLKPPRDEKWDGKWRLFIFDIPEKYRYARGAMRKKIKDLGLYNIQRSVFAYPYDCREELELISEYYGLGKYCTYLETNNIDVDKELRRYFKF